MPATLEAPTLTAAEWIKLDGRYTAQMCEDALGIDPCTFLDAVRLNQFPTTFGSGDYVEVTGVSLLGWIKRCDIKASVPEHVAAAHQRAYRTPAPSESSTPTVLDNALSIAGSDDASNREATAHLLRAYVEILSRDVSGKMKKEDPSVLADIMRDAGFSAERAAEDLETVNRFLKFKALHAKSSKAAKAAVDAREAYRQLEADQRSALHEADRAKWKAEGESRRCCDAKAEAQNLASRRPQLFSETDGPFPTLLVTG